MKIMTEGKDWRRKMGKLVAVLSLFTVFLAVILAGCGQGQQAGSSSGGGGANQPGTKYPTRPIEFIVPWGAGGGADQLARTCAEKLDKILNVSLPVVNVPGATGGTGMTKLLAASADGYSIAIYIADTHALLATSKPSWKLEDITPVARMIKAPSFLFVKQDSPIKTWQDFEKMTREKPGQLKVSTLGEGSVDDITLAYLAGKGIKVTGVPYAQPSERYVSILGGHADALYEQAGDVRQYLESKQMRPIIVFNEERYPAFPDVPCSKELGYDIFLPQFRSIIVRAGTDEQKIKTLAEALKKVYDTPEYQKFLEQQYATKDSYLGPEDAARMLKQEVDNMKAIWEKKQ
ncbi:MAG: putative tricarboxylic transport rane protein [Clostridia bacterium]|nr:putative tricarboxylic transport rane protein [Clostridia bacterium]